MTSDEPSNPLDELLGKFAELELENIAIEADEFRITLRPIIQRMAGAAAQAVMQARPTSLIPSKFSLPLAQYPGSIHEITIGATKGDGENAVWHFQNAIKYFEETQTFISLPFAWNGLGWGYYFMGDMETALKHTERALEMQLDMAYPIGLSMQYYALGMIQCDLGDLRNAQHNLEKALQLAQDNYETMSDGMARALLGRILAKADVSQSSKAEALILQGISILDELRLQPSVYQGYLYLAELYTDTGQSEKAQKIYGELGMA